MTEKAACCQYHRCKVCVLFWCLPMLTSQSKHTFCCEASLACWVSKKPTNDGGLLQIGDWNGTGQPWLGYTSPTKASSWPLVWKDSILNHKCFSLPAGLWASETLTGQSSIFDTSTWFKGSRICLTKYIDDWLRKRVPGCGYSMLVVSFRFGAALTKATVP